MSDPDPVQTEDTFNRAHSISRKQGAMSLELRAAMSLGRFWEAQGSSEKAKEIVAETYKRFTEGLDTKDLIEARNLLERRG